MLKLCSNLLLNMGNVADSVGFHLVRRLRRNRRRGVLRDLHAESHLQLSNLIFPLFVQGHSAVAEPISSLPGIFRHSEASLLKEVEECLALGLRSFILFPVIPDKDKDKRAHAALQPDGLYIRSLFALRKTFPEAFLVSDIALDPYNSDGHDGILSSKGEILNDQTLLILGDMAVLHAEAGADMVAPSDMMDGRVAHIRTRLDQAGYDQTGILSYTAKYASALYGPFREALDSAPRQGDKKSYQMDPRNAKEALEEAQLDHQEGADMLMVKPAGAYLDIIYRFSQHFQIPIAAYQVSGEYAMLKAAAASWGEERALIYESLIAIRRAGASVILTYFAKEVAKNGL